MLKRLSSAAEPALHVTVRVALLGLCLAPVSLALEAIYWLRTSVWPTPLALGVGEPHTGWLGLDAILRLALSLPVSVWIAVVFGLAAWLFLWLWDTSARVAKA